jgi:hypothetical protein
MQWLKLDLASLPSQARLAYVRKQIARMRLQLAAQADNSSMALPMLWPWLQHLPWEEVVAAPEVAERLRDPAPQARLLALEKLAQLVVLVQRPLCLQQVGQLGAWAACCIPALA